ncbi:MAG: outer membrane beta-barrel protein [Flavobacteriales bacterium]
MKKILVIVFTVFSVIAFAQNEPNARIKKRKRKLLNEDAIVLDITSNMWRNAPQGIIQQPLKSLGFNLSFFFDRPLGYSPFALAIGISYAVENVQNNGVFVYSNNFNTTSIATLQVPYASNRFTSEWFDIPLELRLRTKKKGPFRLYIGAKAGINITNYHQFIDHDTKTRDYRIRNLNTYRYGVYARIGYAMFNIYSYYSLSDMVERGNGPQLAPISVGVSFLLR